MLPELLEFKIEFVYRYVSRLKRLATSATAKDTYILFSSKVLAAFLGFLFTLLVARALSVENYGIYSAAANLVILFASVSDFGISTGVVNFVSNALAKKNWRLADKYTKAAFVIRFFITAIFAGVVMLFAGPISRTLLAGGSTTIAHWVALITIIGFFHAFFPHVMRAKKNFFASEVIDNSHYLMRLVFAAAFFFFGTLSLGLVLGSYVVGALIAIVVGFSFVGFRFLRAKPKKKTYKKLIRYSGWVGVSRIISAISGRLDIQMMAVLAGATATGFYSIPSRLATFLVVLAGGFTSVLAPRLAGFNNKNTEKTYILKATLAILPIILGVVVWIIIAKPFITILFGQKYLPSVVVFRVLAAAMIPFLLTAPSSAAILYSIKKPVYIGVFSFFQIAIIFSLNYFLIPVYGSIGPAISLGVVNTLLFVYTWSIVLRHYWVKR